MVSKEELNSLVEEACRITGKTREGIALELNYGKNYISEVLSPTGKITDRFYRSFKAWYDSALENPKRGKMTEEERNDLILRIVNTQTTILEDIRKKMAKEDALAEVQSNLNDLLESRDDFEAQVLGAIHRASERFVGTEDPKQVQNEIDRISRLAGAYHADNLKKGKRVRRHT